MKSLIKAVFAIVVCLLEIGQISSAPPSSSSSSVDTTRYHRMCIPEKDYDACQRMATEGLKQNVHIKCIVGRDLLECMEKIHHHGADFAVLEPEDMYIASNIGNKGFQVFKEIRTKEEPSAEFRYKGVAVVRKDLNIKNISSLKGLNSCHTGVGRNVGYKIPITKLTKMKILGPLDDTSISPRENELKALSGFFGKACLVGKWAPDDGTRKRLKSTYSNLCALCEHPEICDYPDQNSGYEGALRCLTTSGGDVAWTKTIYVEKYFGLKEATKKNNASDYAFLCPDGTKVPIDKPPCTWAARPWPAYVADSNLNDVSELRDELARLNKLGEALSADWFSLVLQLSDKTVAVDNANVLHPYEYLLKAKYYDVIGRDVVVPRRTVGFCVASTVAHDKCKHLKIAAYSRDIRPAFECILEKSLEKCLDTIRANGADIITLDATDALTAVDKYNLKIIAREKYQGNSSDVYAVAVVKSSSPIKTFEDLKGKKSCHTAYLRSTGWVAPIKTLLNKNLIQKDNCPYTKAVSEFFSGGSCIPSIPESLKQDSLTTICEVDGKSDKGYENPLKCLLSGDGDVAFTKQVKVLKAIEDGEVKYDDIELLCPNGGRAAIDQYSKCNLGKVPAHVVVTSNQKTDVELDEINNALLGAANLYSSRPGLFKLFGKYDGKDDLLFLNPATGLELIKDDSFQKLFDDYKTLLEEVNYCETKKAAA